MHESSREESGPSCPSVASHFMAPEVNVHVSESVWTALQGRQMETGEDLSEIVDSALSEAFELERHTLFQVSTSNALAQGVFGGVTTVADLRHHGDFGLGTFDGLDGELVMIDGECFRATAGGVVTGVADDRLVPFALVTRFVSDVEERVDDAPSLGSLVADIDELRPSENLFVGMRADARFDSILMRAACPARDGEGLLEATRHQSEFHADDVVGTLVGFWAPRYSRAVSVPGYHFHFISDDRSLGGHVLDLRARDVEIGLQLESELHLAIPETAEFLSADLSGEHEKALEAAETQSQGQPVT
jgi:acetolactate decarboxylase